MSEPGHPLSQATLPEFFRNRIQVALTETHKELDPHTEYYLVHMLTRFARTSPKGSRLDEPLAFKLKRGLELNGEQAWFAVRELGEVSLLLAGVFSEFLNRRLVDVEYCMGMGVGAYQRLASLSSKGHSPRSTLMAFEEIADRFTEVVEVLWAFQDATSTHRQKDILRLYESWVRTGNPRMKKSLIRSGVLPSEDASLVVH
jgi:hypothetical protein